MTKITITDGKNTQVMEGNCGIAFMLSMDEDKSKSATMILGAGKPIDIAKMATDCFVNLIKALGKGDDMLQSAINLTTSLRFIEGMEGKGNTYEVDGEES